MNIPTKPLGEIVKLLSGGTPSKQNSDYWDGEIPWVSSKEMGPPFLFETEARVTEHGAKNGTRVVPPDTILMVVRGMSLAKEFRVSLTKRTMTFNQDLKAVEPTDCVNPIYLFYVLRALAPAIQGLATEASHGTKKLETPVLQRIKIPLPESQTQTRIAEILSTYDDLIEVNRRRMSLLEEAARELCREWFVRLRFPGHESTPIRNGVPEGWERVALGNLAALITRGITPKYDEESKSRVINQKCIRNNWLDMSLSRTQSKPIPRQKQVKVGDVLINSTGEGTLGRVAQLIESLDDCTVDSHVSIVRPRDLDHPWWLGYSLSILESQISMMGEGATQQTELKPALLSALRILKPQAGSKLVERFSDQVAPMVLERSKLHRQNTLLAEARDHLLPRLMRGEIEV